MIRDIFVGQVRESGCPLTAGKWVSLDMREDPVERIRFLIQQYPTCGYRRL